MNQEKHTDTKPGIAPSVRLEVLGEVENNIVRNLSRDFWYITRASKISLGQSKYTYVLMKPTDYIFQNFNLVREVLFIFSAYEHFEPRVLDVFDELHIQELRLEEVCTIVISKDNEVVRALENILKSNQESRVIIPFTYEELVQNPSSDFFVNQMRRFFYNRDLFGLQDPLKKDIYFFGRNDLIQELANKHLNKENCGIFGLRKTGKTSILYGVQRTLDKKRSMSVLIDCQVLHNKPWNLALHYIIKKICEVGNLKKNICEANKEKYESEVYAADAFAEDINRVLGSNDKRSVLLIFDEIENISPQTSVSKNWSEGTDFIKFWQTIRSTYQVLDNKYIFSYLIAGTNPRCVELPTIGQVDNPIFQQFNPIYIDSFTYMQTSEMLHCLGGYMGIDFSDEVCAHVNEDFGGHPLLMRQMCSYIHRHINWNRPIQIHTPEYQEMKEHFYKDNAGFSTYAEMVLAVLKSWYKDEYFMLEMLAQENYSDFYALASLDQNYIRHLKSYGLITESKTEQHYHFTIEAIGTYLQQKQKYVSLNLNEEQRLSEVNDRRTNIEIRLRKMIRKSLKTTMGEEKAKRLVLKQLVGEREIEHNMNKKYADLFDADKYNLYLKTLFDIIKSCYEDVFVHVFEEKKEVFLAKSELLNEYRLDGAHAKTISQEDFDTFRGIASYFEKKLDEYEE